MSQYRGAVAAIIAFTLGVVLIIIAATVAFGGQVSELTRSAAIGAVGLLVGALVTYLTKR